MLEHNCKTVKHLHRSCGLPLRICIHWKRTDRKLCSETRKVSAHCREKYGEKAGFCSGEGINGRMNQSRQSAWPWSSSACFWKNSCVFSRLPFWKNKIIQSESLRVVVFQDHIFFWWGYLDCVDDIVSVQAGSQLVDCGPVNVLQPGEQPFVQVEPVILQAKEVKALDKLLQLINDLVYLQTEKKKFHYPVHQSLSGVKTNYLKGSWCWDLDSN